MAPSVYHMNQVCILIISSQSYDSYVQGPDLLLFFQRDLQWSVVVLCQRPLLALKNRLWGRGMVIHFYFLVTCMVEFHEYLLDKFSFQENKKTDLLCLWYHIFCVYNIIKLIQTFWMFNCCHEMFYLIFNCGNKMVESFRKFRTAQGPWKRYLRSV